MKARRRNFTCPRWPTPRRSGACWSANERNPAVAERVCGDGDLIDHASRLASTTAAVCVSRWVSTHRRRSRRHLRAWSPWCFLPVKWVPELVGFSRPGEVASGRTVVRARPPRRPAKLLIRPAMVGQASAGDHDDRSTAKTPPAGGSVGCFGSAVVTSTDTVTPVPRRDRVLQTGISQWVLPVPGVRAARRSWLR